MATRKKAHTPEKGPKDVILDAALVLTDQMGWDMLTLADIAGEAGMTLADVHEHIADKTDILTLYGRRVDQKVLGVFSQTDPSAPIRDRLFDIIMERFDVLNADRAAVVSILKSFKLDPKQMVISLPHLCRSMTWMLEAARADTTGWKGAARVAGLTAIYLKALWAWIEDDSADMAKTMKALDSALARAESIGDMVGL